MVVEDKLEAAAAKATGHLVATASPKTMKMAPEQPGDGIMTTTVGGLHTQFT